MSKRELEISYEGELKKINLPSNLNDFTKEILNNFNQLKGKRYEIIYENKSDSYKIFNENEYQNFIKLNNSKIKIFQKEDDKNSENVSWNILLSYFVEFSNNLFKLDYESCNNMLRNEKILSFIELFPGLKYFFDEKLIKTLKIFISSTNYYFNLNNFNLAECVKKLELYQINNDDIKEYINDNNNYKPNTPQTNKYNQNKNFPFSQDNNSFNSYSHLSFIKQKNLNSLIDKKNNNNNNTKSKDSSPENEINNNNLKTYSSANINIFQSDNLNQINKKKESNIFLIIEKNIHIINSIIKSMNIIGDAIGKIQDIYYILTKEQEEPFNEDILLNLIEFLQTNINEMILSLKKYENEFFVKNTFLPFFSIPIEDSKTLLYLIKGYRAILSMDIIEMMNSKIIINETMKKLKLRNKFFLSLRLYIFLFQFKLDNDNKCELIFKTYFDKKKNFLSKNFNFQNENDINENKLKKNYFDKQSNQDDNIKLKNLIFSAKPKNMNAEMIISKLFEEKIEINFISFIFEIKNYLEHNKLNKSKVFYEKNKFGKFLFIEQDEDFGIINYLYIEDKLRGIILPEIKNATLMQKELEIKNSFSSSKTIQNEYSKIKMTSGLTFILYKISNFLDIVIQYKEKSINEVNLIKKIFKKFKLIFSNYHIFKTTIT